MYRPVVCSWSVDTFQPVFDIDDVLRAIHEPLNERQARTLARWDKWLIELAPMLYNHRLLMTPVAMPDIWSYGWCYADPTLAVVGMVAWDPATEDEPAGWHKRPTAVIRQAPHRPPGAPVRCRHGHWPLMGQCENVGCEAWRPAG